VTVVLDATGFEAAYRNAAGAVRDLWTPAMQERLALHCHGWRPGAFDFGNYLRASWPRYFLAYRSIAESGECRTVCDVGGFFGVFPATLAGLGFQVTMTESLGYYAGAFGPLFEYLSGKGVTVVDYDPFGVERSPGRFDAVTVMAVLEHYPHSPKRFMANVVAMTRERGYVYIEVPNIAYWPKRMDLLRGRTPLPPLADIFHSEVPYLGHHHEYTTAELMDLATWSGLRVLGVRHFSYSLQGTRWQRLWTKPLETLALAFLPKAREVVSVLCRREE